MPLTAGVQTALGATPIRPESFVSIAFPGFAFRVSTMTRSYTLGGNVYVGTGALGSISMISDSSDLSATPVQLSLTGLDATLATELRDYTHQGSAVVIHEALFDANGAIIPDEYVVFSGIVDTMSWSLGETLEISVKCDSILRMLFRGPDGHRRMQSDQVAIFPGDLGLEFSANLKEDVPWGVATKIPKGRSGPFSGTYSRAMANNQ